MTRHLHNFYKKGMQPRQGERGGTEQEFKINELIIVSEITEVVQNKKEEQKRGTCSTLQEKEGTKKNYLDILSMRNKMERVHMIAWMAICNHFKKIILKNSPRRHQECIKKT